MEGLKPVDLEIKPVILPGHVELVARYPREFHNVVSTLCGRLSENDSDLSRSETLRSMAATRDHLVHPLEQQRLEVERLDKHADIQAGALPPHEV
jgi:hypothetical protein